MKVQYVEFVEGVEFAVLPAKDFKDMEQRLEDIDDEAIEADGMNLCRNF